jgi:CheY-like chemotaxis protein/phosphoribosyl 1,2-cyclic phosphodiesterase
VEVVTKSGRRYIFDAGTGARPLGVHLMANAPKPVEATILLSHTHWDHIQGFPFFIPLFVPGNRITVVGPTGSNSSLPDVLAGQMEYTYFPVELAQLGAEIKYRDISEGSEEMEGVRISTQSLNHPARALGYRVEADGASLLYLCDHEPFWESLWRSDAEPGKLSSILHEGDRRHAEFMQNADVVIHDAQYTPEEYPAKKNWGHSTWTYVTHMAAAANVKNLFLTHHDPAHDDAFLDAIEAKAQALAISLGSSLKVHCAREGFQATFEGDASTHAKVNPVRYGADAAPENLRVLIVDDDEDLRVLARKSLSRAGYKVLDAESGREGLAKIGSQSPDLVILDLNMPEMDGYEVLRRIRSSAATHSLPVVVLTAQGDEESAKRSFELGATDFLAKPFTPPQLDARVQSSFARAHAGFSDKPAPDGAAV